MPFNDNFEQVTLEVQQAVQGADSAVGDEQRDQIAAQVVQTWRAYTEQPEVAGAQSLGATLARHGLQAHALLQIERALTAAPDGSANADLARNFLGDVLQGYIDSAKQTTQQATVSALDSTQKREDQLRAVIQELSTPIIPIYRGVLVLPLVGAIDSMRSQEITERLLEDIVRQQADLVIIDITGVSVVDTSVANHLLMTAQAVNLLGSKVIFTGISSMIAQTIIQLGVSLGDVVTLSNLQAGMLYALEQLGLGITELEAI